MINENTPTIWSDDVSGGGFRHEWSARFDPSLYGTVRIDSHHSNDGDVDFTHSVTLTLKQLEEIVKAARAAYRKAQSE